MLILWLRQKGCLLVLMLVLMQQQDLAQPPVVADSTDFVTASILVVSPGREPYATAGHCALRMECPSHGLDYCFTYETDINEDLFLRFLSGKTQGGLYVVPTTRYLRDYSREGRGVTAYAMNLTLQEKKELWRSLDEELPLGLYKPFDFFRHNCTTMIYEKVLSVMNEEYVVGRDYQVNREDNRRFFQMVQREGPWTFFLASLLADYVRPDVHIVERQYPVSLARWLQQAEIISANGTTRHLLQSEPKKLVKERIDSSPPFVTPTVAFILLLVWVIAVSVCHGLGVAMTFVRVSDRILFLAYTLLALLLMDVAIVKLFGERWNWMLIPFNVIPFLLWIIARHQRWYRYVWFVYGLVLISFMVFLPFYRGMVEWPVELILVSLLLRCLCKFRLESCYN